MDDLISRQAAIDVIDYLLRHNDDTKRKGHSQVFINGMEDGYFRVRSNILSLPSVQPEPHWIPVTERLPAYGEDVLISIGGYCNVGHVVPVNEEERYNWYFSGWYHSPNDVTAWMPLPEPYQEEGEQE